MINRSIVYNVIDGERDYQDSLGKTATGQVHLHSVTEYLLYMEEYLQQARKIASTDWTPQCDEKTLDVIRKVTALGVACMEQNGAVWRKAQTETTVAMRERVGKNTDAAGQTREAAFLKLCEFWFDNKKE